MLFVNEVLVAKREILDFTLNFGKVVYKYFTHFLAKCLELYTFILKLVSYLSFPLRSLAGTILYGLLHFANGIIRFQPFALQFILLFLQFRYILT